MIIGGCVGSCFISASFSTFSAFSTFSTFSTFSAFSTFSGFASGLLGLDDTTFYELFFSLLLALLAELTLSILTLVSFF